MAIRFETNIKQTLCFPYGDYKEVNGNYGKQFLYTVESDGQRDRLYATPLLHEHFQSMNIAAGDSFTITKIDTNDKRKNWLVRFEEPKDGNGSPEPATTASTARHNGHSSKAESPRNPSQKSEDNHGSINDFTALSELMAECLRASTSTWHSLEDTEFSSDDIRRTATSLFTEANRRGIPSQLPTHAQNP